MFVISHGHDILFSQIKTIVLINVILYSRNVHGDADDVATAFSNNQGGASRQQQLFPTSVAVDFSERHGCGYECYSQVGSGQLLANEMII